MLEASSFIVKQTGTLRSGGSGYQILDGETGDYLGQAAVKTGWLGWTAAFFLGRNSGSTMMEVRERLDDSLVFTLHRGGLLSRSVEVLDAQGDRLGSYHRNPLRIGGGFAIRDASGNHFGDVRGKWLSSDLVILTPDGKAELGRITRNWGELLKELFTNTQAHGVRVNPDFSDQPIAKLLILGAALSADELLGR